ncbi:uncharacterized protein LOC144926506 [Branchiostoma floridae x Branchiostoma belcheri]
MAVAANIDATAGGVSSRTGMDCVTFCRICHADAASPPSPMISPCNCDGTMKYVHSACLEEWIVARLAGNPYREYVECDVCKRPYDFHWSRQLWFEMYKRSSWLYRHRYCLLTNILSCLLMYALFKMIPPKDNIAVLVAHTNKERKEDYDFVGLFYVLYVHNNAPVLFLLFAAMCYNCMGPHSQPVMLLANIAVLYVCALYNTVCYPDVRPPEPVSFYMIPIVWLAYAPIAHIAALLIIWILLDVMLSIWGVILLVCTVLDVLHLTGYAANRALFPLLCIDDALDDLGNRRYFLILHALGRLVLPVGMFFLHVMCLYVKIDI